MALEDTVVGYLLNRFVGDPDFERQSALRLYEEAKRGQALGIPIKEQAVDTKIIGKLLGPEYEAQLQGFEKGDAFQFATRNRQFVDTASRLAQELLIPSAPDPSQAFAGFPGAPSPGVMQAATGRLGPEGFAERLQRVPAQAQTIAFGNPAIGQQALGERERTLQQRRLEEIETPGLALEARRTAVGEGNLALSRAQEHRLAAAQATAELFEARREAQAQWPGLTVGEHTQLAENLLGRRPEEKLNAKLRALTTAVPRVPAMPGAVTPRDARNRLIKARAAAPALAKSFTTKEATAQTDETLDTQTQAILIENVRALLDEYRTNQRNPETFLTDLTKGLTFLKKRGRVVVPVAFDDLEGTIEQLDTPKGAAYARIVQTIQSVAAEPASGGGGADRVPAWTVDEPPATPVAPAAPAGPTPAPAGRGLGASAPLRSNTVFQPPATIPRPR